MPQIIEGKSVFEINLATPRGANIVIRGYETLAAGGRRLICTEVQYSDIYIFGPGQLCWPVSPRLQGAELQAYLLRMVATAPLSDIFGVDHYFEAQKAWIRRYGPLLEAQAAIIEAGIKPGVQIC